MKNPYHLVRYVVDCTPMSKTFKTLKAMNGFISKFKREYKDPMSGYFVDLVIINITGDVLEYEDLNEQTT
jgi:hypothetical protein